MGQISISLATPTHPKTSPNSFVRAFLRPPLYAVLLRHLLWGTTSARVYEKIHTDIVDIWTDYGRFPFAEAVRTYKFLGKHPLLWKLSYDMARFPPTR